MRRASAVRAKRGAQVAVYDALLFLMVVILVSTGMFLYSAKISADGPGFTGTTYQRLADAQLTAVLGRNIAVEGVRVHFEDGDGATALNLTDVEGIGPGPYTVEWALRAYSILTARDQRDEGTWDLSEVLGRASPVFANTTLEGTHFAWELIENGTISAFGSDVVSVQTPDDLPGSRWTSSQQVYDERIAKDPKVVTFQAEVRYHLWLA